MTCRCNIAVASWASICTPALPQACSTYRIWARSRCVRVPDGEDASRALEALVPGDIIGLAPGRQRYTLFTDAAGGVLDDLMVSNQRDHLMLVVNAACKEADEAHLRAHLSDTCDIEPLADRALVRCRGRRRRRRWRASRRRYVR
jgi:folate-binding Fe-S cluster repair protein YgfZ